MSVLLFQLQRQQSKFPYSTLQTKKKNTIKSHDILLVGQVIACKTENINTQDTILLKNNTRKITSSNGVIYRYSVKIKDIIIGKHDSIPSQIEVVAKCSETTTLYRSQPDTTVNGNGNRTMSSTASLSTPLGSSSCSSQKVPIGETCFFHFKYSGLCTINHIESHSEASLNEYIEKH